MSGGPRVLVLHNRYRLPGGEERALDLHLAALEHAGVPHRALVRDSHASGRVAAGTSLLTGGSRPGEVTRGVHELGATVVHAHNTLPLLGSRALAAARASGARVVLHLHNFRLFCAIAVAFRDGQPCFRCRGRLTVPGLALNCRGSLPEAAAYATALAAHQKTVFRVVDAFLAPSAYAVAQLVRLGVPAERIEALPHYLPAEATVEASRAHQGAYALFAGRLAPEKGAEQAIDAARRAGVPLKVAGDGPLAGRLHAHPGVELLGRVAPHELESLYRGAAMVVVPSQGSETFGLSALEAMGHGLPVLATRSGALPELVGRERCVPRGDPDALAAAMAAQWSDPERRRAEGEENLARVREHYGEERFIARLLDLYARIGAS